MENYLNKKLEHLLFPRLFQIFHGSSQTIFGEYFYPASYVLPTLGFIADAVINISRLSNVSVKLDEFIINVLNK